MPSGFSSFNIQGQNGSQGVSSIAVSNYNNRKRSNMRKRDIEGKYGQLVRILEQDNVFGERAVDRGDCRTATVITLVDCDLLVINKVRFDERFQQSVKLIKNNVVKFLASILRIKELSADSSYYYSLILNTHHKELKRDFTLTTQNQPIENLFLISRGSFQLYKVIQQSDSKSEFYRGFSADDKKRIFSMLKGKKLPIALVGHQEIINDEIFFPQAEGRSLCITTCSSSEAIVFQLNMVAVKSLPSDIVRTLGELSRIKIENRIAYFERHVRIMLGLVSQQPNLALFKRYL